MSLNRWLSRFQLSPRSQRVLTEAALDWRHEVATATTPIEAIWRSLRASVGLLRAAVAVCAFSTRDVVASHWMIRLVAWQSLLLLLFRATFQGWIVTRTFATMPIAVALTLITGPAGASPVAGLVVMELVACGAMLATMGQAVGRGSLLVMIVVNYLPLAFVADRVRAASSRAVATIAFLVIAYLSPAILHVVLTGLFGSVPGEIATMSVSGLLITSVWLSIVWFQERRRTA